MVKELNITLDQPSSFVYGPGSTLSGTLTIEVAQPTDYKKVAVVLRGNGVVKWYEQSGKYRVERSESEKYLEQELVLWRSEDSPDGNFPAGRYTYPFQFTLPATCPSTYDSEMGKIKYSVEGAVTTRNLLYKFNHRARQPITVVQKVSATDPQMQVPVRGEKQKTVGCLCCKSGEITFNAELERSGFNVGEEIPVSFYVENGSGRRITVRCELVENGDYYCTGKHKRDSECVSYSSDEQVVNPHTTSGQLLVRVPLPSDVRPAITRANLMKTAHTVNVKLKIPYALNSTIQLPVVIGNDGIVQTSGF